MAMIQSTSFDDAEASLSPTKWIQAGLFFLVGKAKWGMVIWWKTRNNNQKVVDNTVPMKP